MRRAAGCDFYMVLGAGRIAARHGGCYNLKKKSDETEEYFLLWHRELVVGGNEHKRKRKVAVELDF